MSELAAAFLAAEDAACRRVPVLVSSPVTALAGLGLLLREVAMHAARDRRTLRAWLDTAECPRKPKLGA